MSRSARRFAPALLLPALLVWRAASARQSDPGAKTPASQETSAAEQGAASAQPGQIQVQVNVVNVPVTVTDSGNRYITDLKKEDFSIWEDGKPVEVRYFSRDPKQPVIVGFLLDMSNAARLYFKTYQESIGDLAYLLLPEGTRNRAFLGTYATQADFLVKPTGDAEAITEKIRNLKPGGGSAMLDAIYKACTQYLAVKGQPLEPKHVLVVVGDGHDNSSKQSLEQVIEAAQRAQVIIYGVSTVAYGFTNVEESNLVRLAAETGGRFDRPLESITNDKVNGYLSNPTDFGSYAYDPGTGQYAADIAARLYQSITGVAGDITQQYILGYSPPAPFTDRRFRAIRVAVNAGGAGLKVRARKGYFPP